MELIVEGLSAVRAGRRVFSDAAFRLAPGAFAALRGPNGSGKSTLLRVIAGLLPLERGRVALETADGPIALTEDRDGFQEQIAYVGHLDAVKPSFTVRENLRAAARIAGARTGDVLEARLTATLERFQLAHIADAPAAFCSAGQKRRLGLARLLAAPRPVWLLDEPTVALDADANAALGALIDEHRAGGGMALAATHTALSAEPDQTLSMVDFAPRDAGSVDPFLDPAFEPEAADGP